jgi:hypothetical protein
MEFQLCLVEQFASASEGAYVEQHQLLYCGNPWIFCSGVMIELPLANHCHSPHIFPCWRARADCDGEFISIQCEMEGIGKRKIRGGGTKYSLDGTLPAGINSSLINFRA